MFKKSEAKTEKISTFSQRQKLLALQDFQI